MLATSADLALRLETIVATAASEWPTILVPPAIFVAYLGERIQLVSADSSRELVGTGDLFDDVVANVRVADLYLACACARGDATALATFDSRYMQEMNVALARMRLSASALDEVKQLVRHKLFVAMPGDRPKIVEYSGRSGLRRWLRSVTVRTCLNFMRRGKREVLVEDERVLAGVSAGGDDPEIAYMKEKYRNEFRQAFQQALAAVSARQQSLLRYHYVDNLNIDEIGTIYRVHRVTAYRWLEKAREALVLQTSELLKARLNVGKTEFDSILRLIRSELHVSLQRYLGEREPE
ncbi:MAG TPA: sigma-70 family RNA polymerase sigma factor [Kofleriaceae bacterium]|nr:sigma-70 family RNA polymerase sigma factor [Kofleriaceae bacterium]